MGFQLWSTENVKKTNADGSVVGQSCDIFLTYHHPHVMVVATLVVEVYEQPAIVSILVSKTAGRYRVRVVCEHSGPCPVRGELCRVTTPPLSVSVHVSAPGLIVT